MYCNATGGLAATSLINIAFGTSNAYLWFCVLWGMNGLLQVVLHMLPKPASSWIDMLQT